VAVSGGSMQKNRKSVNDYLFAFQVGKLGHAWYFAVGA